MFLTHSAPIDYKFIHGREEMPLLFFRLHIFLQGRIPNLSLGHFQSLPYAIAKKKVYRNPSPNMILSNFEDFKILRWLCDHNFNSTENLLSMAMGFPPNYFTKKTVNAQKRIKTESPRHQSLNNTSDWCKIYGFSERSFLVGTYFVDIFCVCQMAGLGKYSPKSRCITLKTKSKCK